MIAPEQAVYVPELVDRHTGEMEYRAYRDRTHAEGFAAETDAMPIGWETVLERAR